jgi:hypothetical protein
LFVKLLRPHKPTRPRSRLGQALVAGQVALALFLMVGAGLFIRTLETTEQIDAGFDKDNVVLARLVETRAD